MASTTSNNRKAIPLADFAADIARRRQEAGDVAVPKNAGRRRTASKLRLLAELSRLGASW